MNPKYSNIFWHQGVKLFSDKVLKNKAGQVKIAHLENDVTKALINLFQHCGPKVLQTFLNMIPVKEASESFQFDFQVSDTAMFRRKPVRIMLSIISSSTPTISSASYSVDKSMPDACIFNKNISILIEAKTQSPLIQEQIDSHIKNYLGSETKRKTITWEDITDRFKYIARKLPLLDRFLVSQFCDFLDLIGIAEFNGFHESDFEMIGSIGKMGKDDYADYLRVLNRKIEKFMALLDVEIKTALSFKKYSWKTAKINPKGPGTFSAFYFYDDDPKIHINKYPNINFNFDYMGITLSLNCETKSSLIYFLKFMKTKVFKPKSALLKQFDILVFYKFQFLPMDNFVWFLVPGYPKKMANFNAKYIIDTVKISKEKWSKIKGSVLYQMNSGLLKHPSDRMFTDNEIKYASDRNQSPICAFRISKQIKARDVSIKKKNIVNYFANDINALKPLFESIYQ